MSSHENNAGRGGRSILAVLLIASVALNISLLSGCHIFNQLCGQDKQTAPEPARVYDATEDLREIATKLGIDASGSKAFDIASEIKSKLYVDATSKGYPRKVLSDQQFGEVKDALPTDKAAIVADYHKFIKQLQGKRYIIIP